MRGNDGRGRDDQPSFPALRMRRGRSSAVDARHARRAPAAPQRPDPAAVRLRRAGLRGADRRAARGQPVERRPARRPRQGGAPRSAFRASPCSPTRPSDLRTDDGAEALNPDNLICRAIERDQGCGARDRRADRRRARPLHRARPRRAGRRPRLRDQRRHRRHARRAGAGPGRGRRRHRRPVGHDGRPRRRHPRRARGRRPLRRRDHGLCRQICLGLLRPVPRRGRLGRAAEGRQARLSDGPGQRRRGAARGRARHRRGRRHGDGQARPRLSRRRRAR